MADPFSDRIDELEARLDGLSIGDLPFAAIQRKLEQDWQPNGATLLGPSSVTPEMLSKPYVEGFYSTTWPGGVATTNVLIPHTLGVMPVQAFAVGQADFYVVRWITGGTTSSAVQFAVRCEDGLARAAATVLSLSWRVST